MNVVSCCNFFILFPANLRVPLGIVIRCHIVLARQELSRAVSGGVDAQNSVK
jgi:hypothetical protein